jgi:uncharacterized surface protein with fasciclin (FAS1) repeats
MVRVRPLAAVVLASALALAACGSDDNTEPSTPATEAPVETTPATEAPAETTPATDAPAETTPATDAPAATEAPAETDAPAAELGSIIDVATAAGNFTTLLAAVDAAGLTETLSSGSYTLLAPNDEAFAALGQPAIDAVLADPAALTALLQNHVLPAPFDTTRLAKYTNVLTLGGGSLPVVVVDGAPTVGGATIITPDVMADNGIIQEIDTVLVLPPA